MPRVLPRVMLRAECHSHGVSVVCCAPTNSRRAVRPPPPARCLRTSSCALPRAHKGAHPIMPAECDAASSPCSAPTRLARSGQAGASCRLSAHRSARAAHARARACAQHSTRASERAPTMDNASTRPPPSETAALWLPTASHSRPAACARTYRTPRRCARAHARVRRALSCVRVHLVRACRRASGVGWGGRRRERAVVAFRDARAASAGRHRRGSLQGSPAHRARRWRLATHCRRERVHSG